jgi:hypothetical protein
MIAGANTSETLSRPQRLAMFLRGLVSFHDSQTHGRSGALLNECHYHERWGARLPVGCQPWVSSACLDTKVTINSLGHWAPP